MTGLNLRLLAWRACLVPASLGWFVSTVLADEASNVRLVGYHDLQGRQALQVTTRSDSANGNWVYIGHVPNTRTRNATLNPITGRNEWNGTSLLDISDPSSPEFVWHIPNDGNANSRSVSVVYDYGFDSAPPGRDYLIRNSEVGEDLKFQILISRPGTLTPHGFPWSRRSPVRPRTPVGPVVVEF